MSWDTCRGHQPQKDTRYIMLSEKNSESLSHITRPLQSRQGRPTDLRFVLELSASPRPEPALRDRPVAERVPVVPPRSADGDENLRPCRSWP